MENSSKNFQKCGDELLNTVVVTSLSLCFVIDVLGMWGTYQITRNIGLYFGFGKAWRDISEVIAPAVVGIGLFRSHLGGIKKIIEAGTHPKNSGCTPL